MKPCHNHPLPTIPHAASGEFVPGQPFASNVLKHRSPAEVCLGVHPPTTASTTDWPSLQTVVTRNHCLEARHCLRCHFPRRSRIHRLSCRRCLRRCCHSLPRGHCPRSLESRTQNGTTVRLVSLFQRLPPHRPTFAQQRLGRQPTRATTVRISQKLPTMRASQAVLTTSSKG